MEDGNFYRHGGIDANAARLAVIVNLRAQQLRMGGSTVTQQLAKNLFLSKDRTLSRKIPEAFLALALERRFTKSEILNQYVHVIDYGMGQKGIDQAAGFYFHTTPDRLTLAQSAVLVGMVPYNPQTWPTRERLEQGRETALGRLAYWFPGKYSDAEIEAARQVPLEKLLPDWAGARPPR